VVVPFTRGIRDSRPTAGQEELEHFFASMAAEEFDIAMQMHGGGRFSNPFVRRLGARLTAGCRSPDADPLDRWLPYVYYQSEVIRNLEITSLVGADPVSHRPSLAIREQDLTAALTLVGDERPFAVINPGATDPRRCWPEENFVQVADWLASAGLRVVITGTREQLAVAERIAGAMGNDAINLAGQTTVGALLGILHRATIVVSNDTGPLHLAHALGTPTVGIFWCGNLVTAGILSRFDHRPVTSWMVACPLCGGDISSGRSLTDAQRACTHETSFVSLVPPHEVIDAAAQLLDEAAFRAHSTPEAAAVRL
jgi:ADP-heptose:LPS heptosyltransferase